MHQSSYEKMSWFKEKYLNKYDKLEILDVGSLDTFGNYNYKSIFNNPNWNYKGLDFEKGNNVDIIVKDIYKWNEIEDNSYDVVISGQFFEQLKFFWMTMGEIKRILKPNGIVCIIAPSAGPDHGPENCYKFYEDGICALAKSVNLKILHSSTNTSEESAPWHDTCLIAHNKINSEININEVKEILNSFENKIKNIFEILKQS